MPSFGASESAFLWTYWKSNQTAVIKYLKDNYPPGMTYGDFASQFHAEFFDPNQWADVFAAAGAKYVVVFWVSLFRINWRCVIL